MVVYSGLLRARQLGVLCIALVAAAPSAPPRASVADPRAIPNDNRHPAGTLRNGVLTLRLETRPARWRPERDAGPEVPIFAFAEEGQAPRIPGPLVRVPVGTQIDVTLRNRLPDTLRVYGLGDRPADRRDSADVAPGESRRFRLRAGAVGTYFYHARVPRDTVPFGQYLDGQLTGAIVVDSLGAPRSPRDRIFVIGLWRGNRTPIGTPVHLREEALVFNGRTWPHTERLHYTAGDTVSWRFINATRRSHPLHLHGFYYQVTARGTATRDTLYATTAHRTVVTEVLLRGTTMAMQWSPHTPGNWLFHCHVVEHISGRMRPSYLYPATHVSHASDNHALTGMSGLVLGIHVRPRAGEPPPADRPRRQLRVLVTERPRVFDAHQGYSFVLQEGDREPSRDSLRIPGSTLTLTRGEPTAVTVVNRTSETVSVHWHGIELESYFDGVAGWSGIRKQLAPSIAPGDSFIARMTPRRAGTFMYHTHAHELRQMGGGLYAPLIVLEPGAVRDPSIDHILVLATHGFDESSPPSVNGRVTPEPLVLERGRTHRLRFISIAPHDGKIVRLLADSIAVPWTVVAKDGADLPPYQARARAGILMGTGETWDVEVTPRDSRALTVEVLTVGRGLPTKRTLIPITLDD
jgi:manganese oxidase